MFRVFVFPYIPFSQSSSKICGASDCTQVNFPTELNDITFHTRKVYCKLRGLDYKLVSAEKLTRTFKWGGGVQR